MFPVGNTELAFILSSTIQSPNVLLDNILSLVFLCKRSKIFEGNLTAVDSLHFHHLIFTWRGHMKASYVFSIICICVHVCVFMYMCMHLSPSLVLSVYVSHIFHSMQFIRTNS